MKKALLIVFLFSVLMGSVGGFIFVNIYSYSDQPLNDDTSPIKLIIDPGQSVKATIAKLYESGLIDAPFKFRLLCRAKRMDKKIKAGEYVLSSAMSPNQILDTLVAGKVVLYRLTIPEGLNIKQIATLVEQGGFGTYAAFLQLATDPSFARREGIDADSLEGYLFPDTYYFPKGVSQETILKTMVKRFKTVFSEKWRQRTKELGLSVHEIVTLASIIEKETGAAFERPIISSVFHNRLKKKIRLASDPTVIYGIKDFDGNITRKHLKMKTPYNTYVIRGLPVGPIANPGCHSLEAALYPDDTNYLYFVSKKDSTHHFSTNLKAHNKAVRKYQLRK